MNNSRLEHVAEERISSELQRHGILVAKPKFDNEGADLLALYTVDDGARFCRIQCKGRTLNKSQSNHVDVFEKYVTPAFLLCLYIETPDPLFTGLYIFFGTEIIKKWRLTGEAEKRKYQLSLSLSKFESELEPYQLSIGRIENIKHLIIHANTTGEFALVFTATANLMISAATLSATGTVSPPAD